MITKEELQTLLNTQKRKKQIVRLMKKQGYRDVRRCRNAKGTDVQRIAVACNKNECQSVETDGYELYGSFCVYDGYEWIWLEETRVSPIHFDVTILIKPLNG